MYGTQRAFVSANKARDDKFSWGLFEIELPIVVPDECWNMGLITTLHNWCRNIVGQPQDQPAKVTSCTRNIDCPGNSNKCKGIPTDKSWGLFEVQLPLKVPAACWNYGTDTKPHKRCDDVVPRGPTNPGAMLRLSMLSAPTGDGPVWELTSAKAP